MSVILMKSCRIANFLLRNTNKTKAADSLQTLTVKTCAKFTHLLLLSKEQTSTKYYLPVTAF